jgi:hypothetical protein
LHLQTALQHLDAELYVGHLWLSREVVSVCASDLMSDVLSFAAENSLLITGLNNIASVRTAHIAEIVGIIYVRGKIPDEEMKQLALTFEIPLIGTKYSMYEACGILHGIGLPGVLYKSEAKDGD